MFNSLSRAFVVLPLTKSCPRLRGIRAERAQGAMQRGENRAESGVLQATALQDDHIPTSVRGCECNEQLKGERLKDAKLSYYSPLSFAYAQQLPHKWWRLLVQDNLGVQGRPPSRSDRFNGVTGGVQGGLRGEIEIFPGPPAKKVIKTKKSPLDLNPKS